MRVFQWLVTICLGSTVWLSASAQSFIETQPDYTREGEIEITEDDVYRFMRARLEYDVLTSRITYRAALGLEDEQTIYEDYILEAERMFLRNKLTKTQYNDILLAVNHVPQIEAVAVEAFQSMPEALVELAAPVETFEQLQALMDGYLPYQITPDQVPWLAAPAQTETAARPSSTQSNLPRELQEFPPPESLFPDSEAFQ